MNRKNRLYIISVLVIAAGILSAAFAYPPIFNSGADFVNAVLDINIPRFWNKPFKLGLDLQGGTHLVYEADLSGITSGEESAVMAGLRDIIERRVNLFGVREPVVQTQKAGGKERLIVELAGIKDPSEAIQLIGQTPFLEFREQRQEDDKNRILEKQKELEGKTFEEIQGIENWELALQDPYFTSTPLTGKYLKRSELNFDQTTQKPIILLQFNDEGAEIFKELTGKNIGKILAISIDGAVVSAPVVQQEIAGGSAQITGDFAIKEAQELVRNLNAGALPVPITLISQQSVGPTLGKESLDKSLKAGIFGFLAVIVFLAFFYRLPGIVAGLALFFYVAFILALFKLIPVTLTLAGIGGFILSIGMAVDANILIFSRIREELKSGHDFSSALPEGFRRAWPSIRDSNFNSLIVCAILFSFATSFVKGFALTLAIGIILSMFSAIFITRIFMIYLAKTNLPRIKWLW